ncbi:hypothetical protein J4P02_24865 [Pseudomonas sp. NFXW11]|uniref:hypothetical protein n=1 Tax=Pseudomonas sp. NFXW11 TaxID=2819531 RepID=UPI003CE9F4C1
MLPLRSLIIGLSLFACAAHALETTDTPSDLLKAYAATLGAAAGSSQWQQMWKRSRDNGVFNPIGDQPRFTVPQNQLPDMAITTLVNAGSVQAQNSTQALYRYEFESPVGIAANQPLPALCLLVDWRTLPAGSRTDDRGAMLGVSLLQAQPCP